MSRHLKRYLGAFLTCSSLVLSGCNVKDREGTSQSFSSGRQPDKMPLAQRSVINRADASSGIRSMPSQGDVNILVVPVKVKGVDNYFQWEYRDSRMDGLVGFGEGEPWEISFTDKEDLPQSRGFYVDSWMDMIEKAFFGEPEETGFESVSSYYYKSSYGKLNISGAVGPEYETALSYSQILEEIERDPEGYKGVTDQILEDIYYDFFVKRKIYSVDQFDGDRDGVIDAIWMIYDCPSYEMDYRIDPDLMWAYTTWYGDGSYWPGEKDNHLSVYGWASKWFMMDGIYAQIPYLDQEGNLLPDSHTYIHETGHIMGLNDYYDTSSGPYTRSPTASLIMMDHNVYDQDVYSKYLLGWVNPKQYWSRDLYSSETLTLRPFESSGDCVVLNLPYNDGWVGEEYLILCYWTPAGLNETDALNPYQGATESSIYYSGLDEPGIMMFHVDSRFLTYTYDFYWEATAVASEGDLLSAEDNSMTEAYQLAYSNDTGTTRLEAEEDDVQLEMIDASNRFDHMKQKTSSQWGGTVNSPLQETADNDFLFHEGDVYDSSYLGDKGNFYVSFHGEDAVMGGSNDYSLRLGIRVDFGKQTEDGAIITLSQE